jgi:hypothetical protein
MILEDLRRHAGKYYGKYSGEVVDNRDDEHSGRIMVKAPAVFGPDLEVRARPCLPFGHFYVPAIGTKVWVEFEAGDPQYPIWVGTWYPQDSAPQEARIDPPENRVIQTPSGHTIEIMDKDGEWKITIRHRDNSFIAIDKNGSILISDKEGSHIYLNAEAGEATVMSKQGHLLTMNDNALALVNSDGTAFDLQGNTARITASTILLEASTVSLGAGADDQVIKATQFNTLWNLVMTHTHPSAMGPTGTPVPPILPLVPPQHFSAAVLVK